MPNARWAPVLACSLFASSLLMLGSPLRAAESRSGADADKDKDKKEETSRVPLHLSDEMRVTPGAVTIGGKKITYQAEAGLQVVYLKDPMDDDPPQLAENDKPPPVPPEVAMSY